jgi:hypothetical protein
MLRFASLRSSVPALGLASVPALGLVLALGGCVVAVGAGAGYVVSHEVLPNDVHAAQVERDVDLVWPCVRETLEILKEPKSQVLSQEDPRLATANVDGAFVTVEVIAYDLDRTEIRVQAQKTIGNESAAAAAVLNRILERLSS